MGFWIGITITILLVIGVSVFVGRALNKPSREKLSRDDQMMALKASGALRHRKSNRE